MTTDAPTPQNFTPADVHFVTRGVNAVEVSAVTAVIRGLLREESDDNGMTATLGESAWQRSQRGIRSPVVPGPGRWRSFPR